MPVKAGVVRAGARTTRRGAAETFTGVVFQDPVITAEAPSRLGGSVVTFTPGAHRVALSPGWADALLFVRRWPHLFQGREAASAEPRRYGQGQGAAWGAHVSNAEYNEAATGG